MKLVGAISAAVLSLTLGVGIPAYAQQEQHDQQEEQKAKPAQENEKKAEQAKPAQQEEKRAQENKNTRQEEKSTKPEEKATKVEEKSSPQQEKANRQDEKNAQKQQRHSERAQPEQRAGRTGGNHGGRIPDDHFRANFGQEHRFRVSENDYRRDRRFQYGGYWFGFVDPWPGNWLYTQDVFVVEIDGVYYLCNPNYPGVNIALSVML